MKINFQNLKICITSSYEIPDFKYQRGLRGFISVYIKVESFLDCLYSAHNRIRSSGSYRMDCQVAVRALPSLQLAF
jgi:hypothetical protein